MARKILGSGGGGGGGSTFVTKPDTLRSDDNFEILLGLGSGRWKGLVNGLQSLELNGVPLENADGSSNFEDVFMVFADGNPLEDQIVSFQLGGGGNTQTVNTQLVNTTGTGTWVSGSVSTPNANYIDIRFLVNQLFYQDDKSVRENTANIEIEMRPSGSSTWVNIFSGTNTSGTVYDPDGYDFYDQNGTPLSVYLSRSMFNPNGVGFRGTSSSTLDITGKTTSPYVKELRVAVPNTGDYANKTWEVRVRLNNKDTVDTDEIQERRTIILETLAAVITDDLGDDPEWDGLVWAQIHGKASDQFNGFPEITGVFDTKICQVPPSAVFDPEARTYTNVTWDGSFEEAFTTDPAWQIKEFVEDPIHGIAGIYPGATLDKWDALEASKYFSEQVSDGRGGTHPRFSMNLTISEAKEIDEMMQYLAGAVNSYTEDIGGGTWRFKVDKPEDPVMLFTEDNVFTEFQYSHSDIDTRFNDWRGTFLDESLDYETNTVRVFDQDDIDKNGIKFTEVALIGCTHPQEALRRLMFRLRVSLNEFRSVSFETNRIGRLINPLDTILVADGSLNPDHLVKSTSRLDSHSGTTVILKRPLRLETGVAYTIKFSTTDGVIERTVENDANSRGDVTSIEIDSALPAEVMADSAVALEATGLAALPVTYRVLSVDRDEDDEDRYTISAVQVDSGKWNAMDNVSQDDIYAQESSVSIDSPTIPAGGMFNVVEYITDTQHKRVLQVNWDRPAGNFLDGYRVQYRLNGGPWQLINSKLTDSILELQNPEDGTYDFKVEALDRRGVQSNSLVGRYTLDSDANVTPPAHERGDLLDRPVEGPYDGFRFTATDQTPVITQVWDSTGENWVDETNLVTEGSHIGVENGATVGMTPAEEAQLTSAENNILTLQADVSTAQTDINDLVTTYGSTASAAASATAAAASEANTAAALSLTEDALSAAEQARDDAALHATTAQNEATASAGSAASALTSSDAAGVSAQAAETSKVAAETAKDDAETAAQASATSAASAAASETVAGQEAAAATQERIAAETAKGAAEAAETTAVTAANTATQQAATATSQAALSATYADEAFSSVKRAKTVINEPSDYRLVDNFDLAVGESPPNMVQVSDSDFGKAVEVPCADTPHLRVPLTVEAGRKYRLRIPIKYLDPLGSGATRLRLRARDYSITGASMSDAATGWFVYSSYLNDGETEIVERFLDGDTYLSNVNNGPIMFLWLLHDPARAGSLWRFGAITWDDITESDAAATSALASQTSAASASADAAIASSAVTLTATYRDEAEQARDDVNTGIAAITATVDTQSQVIATLETTAATLETTVASQGASITQNAGAISDIEGDTAYLEQIVAADGSNPAMMQLLAGKNGSAIGLVADRIALGNDVDGIIENVLVIEGGKAKINNALLRRAKVAPTDTSEIFHDIQLKPLIFLASDGDIVQYEGGASYGQNPDRIVPDLTSLPALASGESYDAKAINITATQFEAKLKKLTAGASVDQTSNAGSDKGSGVDPRWQTNKPTAADAFNDYYEFEFSGTIPKVSEEVFYEDLQPPVTFHNATYSGTFTLKGKTAGGAWVTLGSVTVTSSRESTSGPNPASVTYTRKATVQSNLDLGTGADHFGIQPSAGGAAVTAFTKVKYTTQTQSNETAVTGSIPWLVYPPVPVL